MPAAGMTAGSVDRSSINATTGSITGTGFAKLIYDYQVAYYSPLHIPISAPTVGSTAAPFSAARPCTADDVAKYNTGRLVTFQQWADLANFLAQMIVYMQGNAVAAVTTQSLGKTTTAGNPIDHPDLPVLVPVA